MEFKRYIVAVASFVSISFTAIPQVLAQDNSEPPNNLSDVRGRNIDNAFAIQLKAEGSATPSLITTLAKIGQPETIIVKAGMSIREIVESRCGTVRPEYIAEIVAQNPNSSDSELLEPMVDDTRVLFPYCQPYRTLPITLKSQTISDEFSTRRIRIDARAIDSLGQGNEFISPPAISTLKGLDEANAATISSLNSGFIASEHARRFSLDNGGVQPRFVQIGEKLLLPDLSIDTTVPIREDVTVSDARNFLTTAAALDGADIKFFPDVQTAELISSYPMDPTECNVASGGRAWPIDESAFANALKSNDIHRGFPVQSRPSVLVVDTGFNPKLGAPAIPKTSLGRIRGMEIDTLPRYVGINTSRRINNSLPPEGLSNSLHGSEVAATLIGGRFLQNVELRERSPKLVFASVAQTSGSKPYLDSNGITEAYKRGVASNVAILNVSLSARTDRQRFLEVVRNQPHVLLVTAAGNALSDHRYPSTSGRWPGSLGGNTVNASPATVISVGAHAPNGEILSRSRYGREQVDILAPGCSIPTYSLATDTEKVIAVERNGTSFAAPLISLVASHLISEGLRPARIKDRLIVSAQLDERLADQVWSGGRLEAATALSIYSDHLVYQNIEPDGTTKLTRISGRIVNVRDNIRVCGRPIKVIDLRKLAKSNNPEDSERSKWRGWKTSENGISRLASCPIKNGVEGIIAIKLDSSDEIIEVDAMQIIDFVGRYPRI